MFVSDDSALAERVRRLKFHGLGVDAYDRLSHGRKPQAEVIEPGFKYNLADLNAALALVQLKRPADALNAPPGPRRTLPGAPRRPARWRRSACPRTSSAPRLAPVLLRIDAEACGLGRDAFMEALKARGIGNGIHFIASHLPLLPPAPAAPEPAQQRVELGPPVLHPAVPDMRDDDIERVARAIEDILEKRR